LINSLSLATVGSFQMDISEKSTFDVWNLRDVRSGVKS
jgi:hypothetical protein